MILLGLGNLKKRYSLWKPNNSMYWKWLINLIIVVGEASSRNLKVKYHLIEDIILPKFKNKENWEILYLLNKADMSLDCNFLTKLII